MVGAAATLHAVRLITVLLILPLVEMHELIWNNKILNIYRHISQKIFLIGGKIKCKNLRRKN